MYQLVIVDDEARILQGICDFYPWEDLGFSVTGMEDGESVLRYVREHQVDVVLTDISMPRMTGIELAEALRREFPEIKIVFLSGHADFEYAQKALRLGVMDYILKPVKSKDLKSVFTMIREALDEKRGLLPEKPENYYEKIVNTVCNYIAGNLKAASLEEAALRVNLSAGYLSTLFKERTGKNFSEYLMDERMKQARLLLMDLNYKTYQVAGLLGYENPQNFARAFKQYYGVPPRDFKKAGEL